MPRDEKINREEFSTIKNGSFTCLFENIHEIIFYFLIFLKYNSLNRFRRLGLERGVKEKR